MAPRATIRTATIALGETTSTAVPLQGRMVTGLRLSSTFEGTALTVTASEEYAGTYAPLYDSDGNAVSIAVGTSRFISLSGAEADALAGAPFIKFVSNAAGGEDAAQDIICCLK